MIRLFNVFMQAGAADRVRDVLASGYIGEGEQVRMFEKELWSTLGGPRPVTVNSGTSALFLSLYMAGARPGRHVVSTPMTCVATNAAILMTGADIVWADVCPQSGLISPPSVKEVITDETVAVVAVDYGGLPCDHRSLAEIHPVIVRDAAQSFGVLQPDATYSCYSLQAIKFLTTGDGGYLTCPDPERARLLRWYGLDRTQAASFRCAQDIPEVGFKLHMNDINAAIGRANLPFALEVINLHRRNAHEYSRELGSCRRIQLPPRSELSTWWLYTLRTSERKAFTRHMTERGVEVSPAHRRNDVMSGFKERVVNPGYPLTGVSFFDSRQVNIPVGWWLTGEEREQIITAVREFDDVQESKEFEESR